MKFPQPALLKKALLVFAAFAAAAACARASDAQAPSPQPRAQDASWRKADEAAARAFDEAVGLHGGRSPQSLARAAAKYEEAIRLWREAGDGLKEARAANNLADVHYRLGDHAKALALFERVLALFEKNHGPDHVEVAKTLNNIANLYHSTGEHAKAEPFQDRSVEVFVRALGPDDPNAAESLLRLAYQYSAHGRHAKATPLFRRALAIDERSYGAESEEAAETLTALAKNHLDAGEFDRVAEKSGGEQSVVFLRHALAGYARMLLGAGRGADALKVEARLKALGEQ